MLKQDWFQMMFYIKKFWSFISIALFLFTVLWLPKDILDSPQAFGPWKRIFSMIDQNTALWAFAIFALIYIFWMDARPFVRAYFDKSNMAKALEISGAVANIRASDSQSIRDLLNGDERDKFVGLLQSGHIRAWARYKQSAKKDLAPIGAASWYRHRIEFAEVEGVIQSLFVDNNWTGKPAPWRNGGKIELTSYYDVHFNKSELKTIWPNVNF